ncbi:MAG: Rieske 2Fe-2S domain-containing protein [Actinobacteria bacterium]|uniref:Unannotated protein n=1 Tax=freshwater metagenome TaxID=449393 RepID=A0A6J7ASL3_9ZZZZ|nr:Rieske 2Fe-2S domain-containing protein [Actinomycetota bacterium]
MSSTRRTATVQKTQSVPSTSKVRQVGWVLLPLRIFLGATMIYAGLLKFFDSSYLDPNSPSGVQSQMLASAATSPISALVTFTAGHATLFGLTIALGELAVGLGILLGLWTRVAALGGLLLSFSFLLTVSWGVTPYFFGPDIVFLFAFTPLLIGGDGGLLSLNAIIKNATRRQMRLAVPAPAIESEQTKAEVDRRTVIRTGVIAGTIGAGAIALGAVGRMFAGSGSDSVTAAGAAANLPTTQSPMTAPTGAPAGPPKGGVPIANASSVAVGTVTAFTDPKTNSASFLLQPKAGTYLAYNGACTHQGCTCGYDQPSNQFRCPCHGAVFDGDTGDVLRGPAKRPLEQISVVESGGVIYAV